MITIEPVVTMGELLGPAVAAVVGFVQCLLIYSGLRQMAAASEERSRHLDAIEKRIEQRDKQMQQQFEQRDNQMQQQFEQQDKQMHQQFEQQDKRMQRQFEQQDKQMQRQFEQRDKVLEDIGAGIREAAAGIRELLQERQ